MNAKEHEALGKVFAAEIENRLPYQSRKAIYRDLEQAGLVARFNKYWGTMKVFGWALTHSGRYEYCRKCPTDDHPTE